MPLKTHKTNPKRERALRLTVQTTLTQNLRYIFQTAESYRKNAAIHIIIYQFKLYEEEVTAGKNETKPPQRLVPSLIWTETRIDVPLLYKLNKQEVQPLLPVGRFVCSMSLTVSQGEGMTVITVTPNPKSKWPVLCQILASLCCSPVCSVSQNMKGKLTNTHTALGIVQMIVGILNIVVGIMFRCLGLHWNTDIKAMGPFWLGSMFLVAGIVCILAAKFPSSCLLVIGMILNVVSAALAITAVALYSVDLANSHTGYYYNYSCDQRYNSYSGYSRYENYRTPSPEENMKKETCLYYKNLTEMVFRGLDIMMMVLLVLQLCVTISFCVLTGKALCKKDEDAKDPEMFKPLLEDDTAAPAC